jgi:hypothetical protein
MAFEGIVAVGLLTKNDVDVLGPGFTRLWPVDESPDFAGLLRAIDQAEQEVRRTQQSSQRP